MDVTNRESGTRVDEVADGLFRINTPVTNVPGGFSFNQYLVRGDLFTQPGSDGPALTTGDILGPSEAFRGAMDYYSHTKNARALLARLAAAAPMTLACMHGSAWQGDGAGLLGALGDALDGG